MACTSIWIMCIVVGQVLAQELRRPAPQEPEVVRPAPPPPGGCRGGFTVRKAMARGLGSGQKVRFQEVLTNTGGWSQSSSTFRAPCNGLYYFSFHAVSAENNDFTMSLMKDGDYQVTAYGSKDDFQHGSNSALLDLRRGDTVYLELQDGKIYEHPNDEAYTSFTGFLVDRN